MSDNKSEKIGILLVNLGTPTEPTPKAVRAYLAEFLSDSRVIAAPMWLWKIVLHGIILRTRPAKVAKLYQEIWTEEGSPIRAITYQQADALQKLLDDESSSTNSSSTHKEQGYAVAVGMTYGEPSLVDGLLQLRKQQVDRVVVLPLYPQYSATTTAAVHDGVARAFRQCRHIPRWDMIRDYYCHPMYIRALAESVRPYMVKWSESHRLLISYHGIPKEYADQGDPYPEHCHKTTELLVEALGLQQNQYQMAFQSRFGPKEWLKPYADEMLEGWPKEGVKHAVVLCPGFAADCLETLEEIGQEFKDIFMKSGGESYTYIPALNTDSLHIEMMAHLISDHLG